VDQRRLCYRARLFDGEEVILDLMPGSAFKLSNVIDYETPVR
jgi:hypothetical protein